MKFLILTLYPAPYRVCLFEEFAKQNDVTVFFERENDGRNEKYIQYSESLNYFVLNNDKSNIALKECLKNIKKYDVVMLFEYHTKLSRKIAFKCILNKVKYLINCDGAASVGTNFFKRIVKSFLIKRAFACCAGGNKAKEYFMYYGCDPKNIVIHNFTSIYADEIHQSLTTLEKEELRKKNNLNGKHICITAGRFIYSKRFDLLIKIWKKMPEDNLLLIVGDGELKSSYLEMINALGLNNVKIIPFLKKKELMEYYLLSDLFVFTSSIEAWGLVINEAIACSLPIVTNQYCTAAVDIVSKGKCGVIVEQKNDDDSFVSKFANTIIDLLNDKKILQSLQTNAFMISQNYTYEKMSKTIIDFIHEKYYE